MRNILCCSALLAYSLCTGCQSSVSSLEYATYRNSPAPLVFGLEVQRCFYRLDAGGDRHITAELRVPDSDEAGVQRLLHVHMFWRPHPGRTFANETTNNAVLRLVTLAPEGTAVLSGSGFVYPDEEAGGWLIAEIESAGMRLDSTTGDVPVLLGDGRLTGRLIAWRDDNAAMSLIRTVDRLAEGE